MTDSSDDALAKAASEVADRLRDGVYGDWSSPEATRAALAELSRRCPGLTEDAYSRALSKGLLETR